MEKALVAQRVANRLFATEKAVDAARLEIEVEKLLESHWEVKPADNPVDATQLFADIEARILQHVAMPRHLRHSMHCTLRRAREESLKKTAESPLQRVSISTGLPDFTIVVRWCARAFICPLNSATDTLSYSTPRNCKPVANRSRFGVPFRPITWPCGVAWIPKVVGCGAIKPWRRRDDMRGSSIFVTSAQGPLQLTIQSASR